MTTDIAQLMQSGLQHHYSGRLQEAANIYEKVLQTHPDHPDPWHLLGVVAMQTGNNEKAAELIGKAIAINPGVPDFHINCGEAYRALRKYDLAIACYEKALAIKPDLAGAHNNLGNIYKETGDLEAALDRYEQAITTAPEYAEAHNNKGIILRGMMRHEEALASFEQALAVQKDYAEAHNNLANTLRDLDRTDEAVAHYEQALSINPDYAEAHSNLGNALKDSGQKDKAISHYERALALQPGFAMAHYNLGIVLDELQRPGDAVNHYRQAIAAEPDYAEAHHNLANALDELGKQDEAVLHYRRAISIRPGYAEAHRNLTTLRPDPEQVPVLEKLLQDSTLPGADIIHCHYALGNIYNSMQSYDRAFEHYQTANSKRRKTISYDAKLYSSIIDRLIAAYTAGLTEDMGKYGSGSDLPVFIVGMPRSGTTLVEQIIASHPMVYGAGELDTLVRIEESIADESGEPASYPESIGQLDRQSLKKLSGNYLARLAGFSREATRITDKLPGNFTRIGLIRILFPNARIIHCQRNALDTCISNYLHYFAHGNDFSFDLTELGLYYLDYLRIMRHWQEVTGNGIFNVRYEDVVGNQEETSRALLAYLELPWDDCCLEFYRNSRAVNPYSSMQVRQPVYTGSIDRWKRYEQHLSPLLEILDAADAR